MGNAEISMLTCENDEFRQTFQLIFDQTIRGKNLTKNLIAFAQSQEPKQEFFSIYEKLNLVLRLLKKDLKGIELTKTDRTNGVELLADPGMIEHSLVNLILNSIHSLSKKESPKLIFNTYCSNGFICFEIKDNGCGIPEKYQHKIFEPSFTLKGSKDSSGAYKPGIKGTGYGLANVKKYVELHKGDILVTSETGRGTKFVIRLPIIRKELSSEEKKEFKQARWQSGKTILLVEDEKDIVDLLFKILTHEPFNHKVDVANTAHQALSMYAEKKYNCLSLDYILEGIQTGMDIYTTVRKENKKIPILFLSGNIEFLESIRELQKKDAYLDHLSKPCQNKNYLNSINRLLEK